MPSKKFGNIGIGFLVGASLSFDVCVLIILAIPVVGQLIGPFIAQLINVAAYILFFLWLKIGYGVSFIRVDRALPFFGSGLLESIPYINGGPSLTIGIIATIYYHNKSLSKQDGFMAEEKQRIN
ncbi:MAG: hypothetical protein Q8P52_01955 [bacterium]|nr:hypothetical protein [bacterium]